MDLSRQLKEFRAEAGREKNKRRGAFFYNFLPDEGLLFWQQMYHLQQIFSTKEVDLYPFVPLEKPVFYYDELTDEQICCYFSLRTFFASLAEHSIDEETDLKKYISYGKLYLLELASDCAGSGAGMALSQMFAFRDVIYPSVPSSERTTFHAFYISLMESFLIAHTELSDKILDGLKRRGISPYENVWSKIRQGEYVYAGTYVRQYARLINASELDEEKDYVYHAWRALQQVFESLEDMNRVAFRHLICLGKTESIFIKLLPVKGLQSTDQTVIPLTTGISIRRVKAYGRADQWSRENWHPYAATGDLLKLIYVFTESFMREKLGRTKRAKSIQKIVKKQYKKSDDQRENILAMRKLIGHKYFEMAIEKGVTAYLQEHPEAFPARKTKKVPLTAREKREKVIREMDQGKVEKIHTIDKSKLARVKQDMTDIVEMLHKEEIDYAGNQTKDRNGKLSGKQTDTERLDKEERIIVDKKKGDSPFSPVQWDYLWALMSKDSQQVQSVLSESGLSESMMVKDINEKALQLFDDILLERENGRIVIISDYLEDLKALDH